LLADRKEKVLLAIGTAALLVNVAINIVALHYYNFTAAGVATALTEFLYLLGALIAFQIITGRSAITTQSAVYLLPAVVMGGILYWMRGGPAVRVGCGIVLGGLAVTVILLSRGARQFRKEIAGAAPMF